MSVLDNCHVLIARVASSSSTPALAFASDANPLGGENEHLAALRWRSAFADSAGGVRALDWAEAVLGSAWRARRR